jgi:beta-fructofuranosidase
MESSAVIPGMPPLLPYAYAPLPSSADGRDDSRGSSGGRWRACAAVLAASAVVLVVVAFLAGGGVDRAPAGEVAGTAASVPATPMEIPRSRGKDFGVSEKASGAYSADGGFPWSNAMLQWQRTGFHFQPDMHYMNGTALSLSGFSDSDFVF